MLKLNNSLSPKKLALYLAVPSAALVIYLLWKGKKENEEILEIQNMRLRQTIIELKVPADCVRDIIGSEGSIIKEIQKNTNTRINFKDKISVDTNEERTLIIRGTNVNAQRAEMEVKRIIADKPLLTKEEILVPKESCGRLIGKGGANIKYMCKVSGCKISLDKYQSDIDALSQKIFLIGNAEQILLAKELIHEKIREEEVFRRKKEKSFTKTIEKSKKFSSCTATLGCENELFDTKKPIQLEFPNLGLNDEVEVFVSVVANPNTFWIHLITEEGIELDNLIDRMNNYYDKHQNDPSHYVSYYKIGDIIAANNGKGWFRAEIKGIEKAQDTNNNFEDDYDDSNDLIDLYYIDFGDSEYTNKDNIRKLKAEFNNLPCQAIECSLHGIQSLNKTEWSEDEIIYFEDVTYSCQWKPMIAKFVAFKTSIYKNTELKIPTIQLINREKQVNIAQQLVEKVLNECLDNEKNGDEIKQSF